MYVPYSLVYDGVAASLLELCSYQCLHDISRLLLGRHILQSGSPWLEGSRIPTETQLLMAYVFEVFVFVRLLKKAQR